jgi:hypothetical protein
MSSCSLPRCQPWYHEDDPPGCVDDRAERSAGTGSEFSVTTPFVPNDASGAPALVNLAANGTSLLPL